MLWRCLLLLLDDQGAALHRAHLLLKMMILLVLRFAHRAIISIKIGCTTLKGLNQLVTVQIDRLEQVFLLPLLILLDSIERVAVEAVDTADRGLDPLLAGLGFLTGDFRFTALFEAVALLLSQLLISHLLFETSGQVLLLAALEHGLLDADLLHGLRDLPERVMLLARFEGLEDGLDVKTTRALGLVLVAFTFLIDYAIVSILAKFVVLFFFTGYALIELFLIEVIVPHRAL